MTCLATFNMHRSLFAIALTIVWANPSPGQQTEGAHRTVSKIDFSRDIRPILSDTCFKCHGPDPGQRQTDLRLDRRASVFDETAVVVHGKPEDSELYLRLTSEDPDMSMPPPDSGRELDERQIELIRQWIEQGAPWGEHWSFVAPKSPPRPELASDWIGNDIDRFILRRLNELGIEPSPSAVKTVLVRRLYFDLTGLPPTAEQVSEFVNDPDPHAYENLVDRLLASPHYGEHMGRYWLDVVRYGDTHGLHLDNYREHWPYRDWIIQAFNDNKSFKEFAIEQLAGDLLDEPTRAQLIATGFNRAHVTTNEGGSIKDEILVRNVVDRVSTVGTVFMGLTIGCAVCHDHKFDPISQKEFYQLFAYFNSLDGDAMDGNRKDHAPVLQVGTDQQMSDLENQAARIADLEKRIKDKIAAWTYVEPDDPPAVLPEPIDELWIDDSLPDSDTRSGNWNTLAQADAASGSHVFVNESEAFIQDVIQNVKRPWTVAPADELFAYVYLDPQRPPREIMLQWNDGNWEHRVYWGEDLINFGQNNTPSRKHMGPLPRPGAWHRISVAAEQVNLRPGQVINGLALSQFGGRVLWDKIGRRTKPSPFPPHRSLEEWTTQLIDSRGAGLPGDIKTLAGKPRDQWNDQETLRLRNYFIEHIYAGSRSIFDPLHRQLAETRKQREALEGQIPTTLIYREKKEPREAFLLNRGQYDQPGEKVARRVPAIFDPLPPGAPNDRLGLAWWLFSGDHPLTARVAVNRFWQQIFGRGLVETSEDFGSQGQFPSHPDLLDHLATEFVQQDWDVKWLMKYIVMSSTYRQSSRLTNEQLVKDPRNRFLGRGVRYRLDAEVLRDQALAVSGLLVPTIGGPSVKPPQPDGLWFAVGYSGSNTVRFKKDSGHDKVHRRSLYTFWKRTAPPPQMAMLDAPSRESCVMRRERTNTPLQALMLMNDPQYVEAARHLAQRMLKQTRDREELPWRVEWIFQRCLARSATAAEIDLVKNTWHDHQQEFAERPERARQLIQIGETPAQVDSDPEAIELAAWTMVANLIMNMDEFVTRN